MHKLKLAYFFNTLKVIISKFVNPFRYLLSKKTLVSLLLFFALNGTNAQIISNTAVNNSHFCLGSTYMVTFNTSGFVTTPNTFNVELSDINGIFTSPTTVGTSTDSTITITIPIGLALSNNYKIRVVKLASPTVIGNELSNLTITKPTPSFTITNNNACAGSNISFNNTSTGLGALSYSWNFSATAGAPSSPNTNFAPTVQFNPVSGGGTIYYPITLTVTDGNGCINSVNSIDSVKQKPDAILTDSNIFAIPSFSNCQAFPSPSISNPNFRLTINNASYSQSLISSYSINWGVGTTLNLPNTFTQISNLYTSLGVFNINFTANNTNGCSNSKTYRAVNQSNPGVGLNGLPSTIGCAPITLPFVLGSYQSNSPGTYYIFDFDDGTPLIRWDTIVTDTIWHTYTTTSCIKTGGAFTAKVKAYNYCDSTPATQGVIRIWTKPKASFNINPDTIVCAGNSVNFINTTIAGRYGASCLSTTSYTWLFPGGTPISSNLQTPPSVVYSSSGSYIITLITSNPCGNDTFTETICVQPTPIPNFTFLGSPINGCKNNIITITNTSNTLISCGKTTYNWVVIDSLTNTVLTPSARFNFVSPTSNNSINPVILFTQSGIYKIRLQVTNSCGTIYKDTFIIIKDKPIVSLPSAKVYCDSQTIIFSNANLSHTPVINSNYGTINSYNWAVSPAGFSFTNGTANSPNPTISFSNTGTSPIIYTISLLTINECGLSNIATQQITINPKPSISNAGLTQVLCGALTTNKTANTPLVGLGTWALVNGPTGSIIGQINNPNTNISGLNSLGNPSIYIYSWTISQNGCLPSISYDTIKVYPATNPGIISSAASVCSGTNSGTLTLTGNAGNIVRWEQSVAPFNTWSNIANLTASQNYLNLTQTTWYRAVVQSGGICSTANSPVVIITVDSMTVAGNLIGTDTVCTGINSGVLSLINKRGNIVNWQFSTGLPTWNNIGTTIVNPYTFNNLTQTTWFRVVVKNGVCPSVNSDSVKIQVDDQPSNAIAPDKALCASSLTVGTNDNLLANSISTGIGLWTYLSGPNTPIIVSPNSSTSAINNLAIGSHNILWQVSNGNCPSSKDTLNLVVYSPIQSSISGGQVICSGQTPSLLIGTLPIGGNGFYTYQWQSSADGINWIDIISATNINYQPGTLTSSTWYRRKVVSNVCNQTTNIVFVQVLPSISNNTISPNAAICIGGNSPVIIGSAPSGGNSTYKYQWQKYNGTTWINTGISDTLKDFDPGTLLNTSVFRRIISSSFCNGIQASISNSDTIKINPLPIVNAGNDSTKCQNQSTYALNGSPLGGIWTGLGVSSNTFNPSAMPLGTYTLIYTYTDVNGCTNSDTSKISIILPPIVEAGNNFSICQNASSIQLTGFSPIGGTWSGIGVSAGGLFNPTIAGAGSFYLKYSFTAGSGCQGLDSLLVTVNPRPNGDFILANQICPNGTISITANVNNIANVNGFAWTISNNGALSNNILSSYNNANTTINFPENKSNIDVIYTIKLNTITDFGCIDSNTHTISLRRRPLAQFTTGSNINCGPATYSMVNGTSNIPTVGLSYFWSVSPSINVLINTITSRNPQIILPVNNSGISLPYNISLIISRNDGTLSCSDTVNNSLTIYPKPIISFSALPKDSGCSPLLVNFSNSSNPRNTENINTMSFLWNFGIYGTDTSKNTQRTFTNSGIIDSTINVKVIGTTQWGCKDSSIQTIKVYPFPKANFSSSIYTSCAPFLINNSIVSLIQYHISNDLYSWQILNKNGIIITSSTGTTIPTYIINTPNDTVYYRLITSHTRGCKSDTLTRMFSTIANPQASFTMIDSTGCTPLTVSFNNTSIVGVTSSWSISNGAIPTNSNSFAEVFNNFSNKNDTSYTAKLVITAGTGCKDSITKNITVYPKPKAIFGLPSNACPLSSLNPINNSIFKPGSVKYGWSIIEPTATIINDTTLANPLFSFGDNQGTFDTLFNVTLLVTSVNGCTDRDTQNIRIFKRPLAFFTVPPTFCGTSNVNILNSTPLNSNWLWSSTPIINFNSSTIKNPAVTFPINSTPDSINYNIKLIATRNGTTCVDSTTRLVTIYPRPKADFTITTKDSCRSRLVNFTNKSIAKNSEPFNSMSFLWTYLNNSFSTLDTSGFFTNSPINDSIYKIRLIATSQHGCKDTLIDSVIVRPDAKASFTYTTSTSCAPFLINSSNLVTNVYSNANSIYKWYANNNLLGISNSFPGYTIATANDSVLIKLVTISKNGCKNDSMEVWFKTINNPKPNFLAIDSIGCSPLLVNFNNISTPLNGLSYKWEFGNASNQSIVKNPSFTFNNYGNIDTTIIVKLVVIAGITGCKDSIEKQIIVKPLPNPEFVLSDSVLCFPNKLTVSNNSFNIPTYKLNSIKWKVIGPDLSNIKNDTTSTFTTIHFADNQTGLNKLYQVRLIIKSNFGCEDSIQKTIRIPTRPLANFSFSTDSSCAPIIINTNNVSQYVSTFNWHSFSSNVVVNNPSLTNTSIVFPSHKGVVDSVYSVRLIALTSLGCSDTLIKPFKVFPLPISNFTMDKDSGCSPLNITFFNNSISKKPSNSVWNFGDGLIQTNNLDTLSKAFNGSVFQDTSYIVKLITTSINGCKDTSNRIVKVKASAFAKIKLVDTLLCSSLTNPTKLRIENKSYGSVDTFYWDFGDGKTLVTTSDSIVNHPYGSEGLFKIVLKAINSCKVTFDSAIIKIQTPPNVNFVKSDSIGCSPLSVSFTNSSTNTFDAKYLWSFGNGNTSNLFNPTISSYLQSRTSDTTYLISLKVSNICGIFEKRDSIKVLPKPIAIFLTSTDSGCSPLPVYMINQSTGLPVSYKWYFGNGDSSSRFNPLQLPVTYQTIDSISYFGIKLIAVNTCGIDSMEKTIKVFPNTVNSFFTTSGNTICQNTTVRFNDFSTGASNISWNFGDGNTSLLKNPTHTFINTGTYYAYQYVNNGCSFDTSFVIINVLANPSFTISKSVPQVCVNSQVQFNANLKDSGVITWYFGDSDSSNSFNPIHIYKLFGKKIITVQVKSFYNSCLSYKTDSILVSPVPQINVLLDTNQACAYKVFNYTANSPQTNIFNWDFGDTYTSSGTFVKHLYQNGGTFNVRIVAQTTANCFDTTYKQIIVFPVPIADFNFTPKDTCTGPVNVKFTNLSIGAFNYLWDFGKGNTSTLINPTFTYSNVGVYPIKLISSNQFNCFDTAENKYFVYQMPKAALDFIPDKGCPPLEVTFINKSSFGTSYFWDFGDGQTDTLFSPKHIYDKSGNYKVKLIAIAGGYCFDTLESTKTITVFSKPKPVFTYILQTDKKPYRTVIFNSSTDSVSRFEWFYNDRLIGRGKNPTYRFDDADSGILEIVLKIVSIDGCDSFVSQNIELPPYWNGLYVPNAFTPTLGEGGANEFKPIGIELKYYQVRVFNKWGELMWESKELTEKGEPKFGWDGNDRAGLPCPQGSFVWVIDAEFTDGKAWRGMKLDDGNLHTKGNVTLIR